MEPNTSVTDFAQVGLPEPMLAALNRIGIHKPTPIQAQAIPAARKSLDVMGIAETGTGKTLAFSLPIIEKLLTTHPTKQALIVVPTRELALQVQESIRALTRVLAPSFRTACLIGGMSMYQQKQDLRANPRIMVATPGRMWDHLQQRSARMDDVAFVVLDEADRMFDMGFAPQIKRIMDMAPAHRQTLCFSATMAPEIAQLAHAYMKEPVTVKVSNASMTNVKIDQELCYVRGGEKTNLLDRILSEYRSRVIVFTRTKHGAKKLTFSLRDLGHKAAEIHSNRTLSQRRQALDGFKDGRYRVLVATDVAARGIDVSDIELVVNYDLPDASEDYVHRIGRTGRAGKTGKAIAFAAPDQARDVRSIERLIKQTIPLSKFSDAAPANANERSTVYSSARPGQRARNNFRPQRSGGSGGGGFSRNRSGFQSRRPQNSNRTPYYKQVA